MSQPRWKAALSCVLLACAFPLAVAPAARSDDFRLATFKTDVTIPLGHRCMGILPRKAEQVVDPLYACGFVLLGPGKPIVLVSVDWCEIRNASYDQWRDALAEAAGTDRQRVLVCSVHQHDAPVVDVHAEQLLASVSLAGELFDTRFHDDAVRRTAAALRDGLDGARRVTHLGFGKVRVEKIASSRRVVHPDGRVSFSRYSRSGGDAFHRDAPEGDIDPWLKSISFYDGQRSLATLSVYATHPMSYYGRGEISADFVGMARDRRQRDDFQVAQIYASGASGDVTAGKYNDGSTANRPVLAERLYRAMKAASDTAQRTPLEHVDFRTAELHLEYHDGAEFTEAALLETLHDAKADVRDRILAAMGLSSRRRVASGQAIDVPCVDFGPAQIVLLPGEAFVGYQLIAQQMRPDSLVVCIGYGECWPGYIPTRSAFEERFGHGWRWVAPGAEKRMRTALEDVLLPDGADR
jgi:hypothetical protein